MVIIRENENRMPELAEPTLYEEMTLEQPGDLQITDPKQGEFLCYQSTDFQNYFLK